MRPAEMAALLGNPIYIFLIWIIAGVFTLFAAMVSAEMGAMMPHTGGQYIYLHKIYGPFWSYLFGWANFSVINTAGTAGIAYIFATYLQYFFKLPALPADVENASRFYLPMVGDIYPLREIGLKVVTIIVLGILTTISYISTKWSSAFQAVYTIIKIITIVLLIGGLFFSGAGSFAHFTQNSGTISPRGLALVAALVAACNGALQAYDGWGNVLTISGELKDPAKNIPRSLLIGVSACILIYTAITAAMMYVLPVEVMARSQLVASDAAKAAFGNAGGGIIAFLICVSVLGTSSGNVLAPPRMTFAMYREKNFFAFTGKIHPRFKTPGNALWLHFLVMAIMVLSGSFYALTDMYIFVSWLFNLMLIAGLFVLRRRMPEADRPYQVWAYPFMPLVLLGFTAFYLIFTLYNDIHNYILHHHDLDPSTRVEKMNAVFGIILVAIGIPFYFYFRRKNKV
jgi:APA family basic amino acid/polyamine antiporter